LYYHTNSNTFAVDTEDWVCKVKIDGSSSPELLFSDRWMHSQDMKDWTWEYKNYIAITGQYTYAIVTYEKYDSENNKKIISDNQLLQLDIQNKTKKVISIWMPSSISR
jgi:hypothetical protein